MSKLAHSHQPTMDLIDMKRAIEDGNEDLIAAFWADVWAEVEREALQARGKRIHY